MSLRRVYLLRHAIAVEREVGFADPERPLTPEGRKKLRRVLAYLKEVSIQPDLLLTSPYLRCLQTARALQRSLDCPLRKEERLAPRGDYRSLLQDGLDATAQTVLLVGHEPDLSEMVGWMTTGEAESFLRLKKAGLVGLEWNGHRGQIVLLTSPRWLATRSD